MGPEDRCIVVVTVDYIGMVPWEEVHVAVDFEDKEAGIAEGVPVE